MTFTDENGNEIYKSESISKGSSSVPPFIPERTGYLFVEWVGIYENVMQDEEVRASWRPIEYKVIYCPNFGDKESNEPLPTEQPQIYDVTSSVLNNQFARAHYEFLGWNTAPDGSGDYIDVNAPIRNWSSVDGDEILLYAQWKFYIEMPETGSITLFIMSAVGLMLVVTSLIASIIKTRRRVLFD